jgi:hypothetical protein
VITDGPAGVSRDMRFLAAAALATVLAACAPATTSLTPIGARQGFLTYAFTDVRDGAKFTLSDFAGKTVLVIGMAAW